MYRLANERKIMRFKVAKGRVRSCFWMVGYFMVHHLSPQICSFSNFYGVYT